MWAGIGLLVLALAAPDPALACSMCRCSDPVFNALGKGLYTESGFQVALDWSRLDQSQGEGADIEEQVRNTVTATVSYSWQERLTFIAQVPYTFNELTEEEGTESADGLADPVLYTYVRLWSSTFGPGLGRRAWLSGLVAVKTPWGENDASQDGERLDEHVQPGTGATNVSAGGAWLYLIDAKSSVHASAAYTWTGRNKYGYEYGDNLQVNAAYEHKLSERFDGFIEINFLNAAKDQVNDAGVTDPNTGGRSLYLTPRIGIRVVRGLVLRAAVQIPVWEDLNGVQDVKPAYSAGLSYIF